MRKPNNIKSLQYSTYWQTKFRTLTFITDELNTAQYCQYNSSLKANYTTNWKYIVSEDSGIWSTAHHMPLKLFFTLHKIEAKLTEVQLHTIIVFRWKGGKVPCLDLISSKLYSCYIFHFCELFMFSQTGSIKLFMTLKVVKKIFRLYNNKLQHYLWWRQETRMTARDSAHKILNVSSSCHLVFH